VKHKVGLGGSALDAAVVNLEVEFHAVLLQAFYQKVEGVGCSSVCRGNVNWGASIVDSGKAAGKAWWEVVKLCNK